MATFTPFNGTVTSTAGLVYQGGGENILITNLDLQNNIYLGGDLGVNPNSSNITGIIPPLGSMAINDSGFIYGITASPGLTAAFQVIPNGTSFSPSASQIAQQIQLSGVTLVDNPKTIFSNTGDTIGAGAVKTYAPVLVNAYQSFQLEINTSDSVAGTTPYIRVAFIWSLDAGGTNDLYKESWVLPVGTTTRTFMGNGPMASSYMRVIVVNYDTQAMTFGFNIQGSMRTRRRTDIRQLFPLSGGVTNLIDDLLLRQTGTIPAAGTAGPFDISYFNGPVTLRMGASGLAAANKVQFSWNIQPNSEVGNGAELQWSIGGTTAAPQSDTIADVYFPRRPVTLTITNNDTNTITYNVAAILGENS